MTAFDLGSAVTSTAARHLAAADAPGEGDLIRAMIRDGIRAVTVDNAMSD
jgi:translation elongation factor EF-Tu-like GTPase